MRETIHEEQHPSVQHKKAIEALKIAKQQEKEQLKAGANYIRVDSKTIVLKSKRK